MYLKQWSTIAVVLCLIFTPAISSAAPETAAPVVQNSSSPMQLVQKRVNSIIDVLNDAQLGKPENRTAQRDKIWGIANMMFDFDEISRRTVGNKWTAFSDAEKKQFTDIFARFLYNTYIEKVEGEYSSEKIAADRISWDKELIKGDRALVRTRLLRASAQLPIDYKMQNKDGEWKIYDILVENGVSIVQNYRVQFKSILEKETPAQLIVKLQKKLDNQQSQSKN